MANISIGGRISLLQRVASLDLRYGPYSSIADAYDNMGPSGDDVITAGLPFGVTEDDGSVSIYIWTKGEDATQTDCRKLDKEHIVLFNGFIDISVSIKQQSYNDVATKDNIVFLNDGKQFAYRDGLNFYINWKNRYVWSNESLIPYDDVIYININDNKAYYYNGTTLTLLASETFVSSINNQAPDENGNVNLTKEHIGLEKVDNTSDTEKVVKGANEDGSGNNIATTYETKSDATTKNTALQGAINALQTSVGNLTGLDSTNFGGFSIQSTEADAISNIATLYIADGYTNELLWYMAGTSLSSVKAYRYNGSGTPTLISNDSYDCVDFSGLITDVAALGQELDKIETRLQNVRNYTEFGYILTLSDLPTTGKLQSDGSINEAYTDYKISDFISLDKVAKLAYHRAEDISSTTGVGLCLYDEDLEVVGSTGWDSTHSELDLTQYPTAKYFRICAHSSAFKCFVAFSNEVTERTKGYFPIGSTDKKYVNYSTGILYDNTNYIVYDVGVKRGISLTFNQYYSDYAGYAFFDKYGNYISGGGLSGTQGSSATIQVPEYAVRVKISCIRDYLHDFSVKFDLSTMVVEPDDFSVVTKKIDNKAVTMQKVSFLDIADNVNLIDGWENGFINANGVPTSNSTLRMTTKVYMSPSHSYYCRNLINGYYAFYGKDDMVLASYANNEGQLGTQPITPPVGTVYGRFTTNNEAYSKRAYIGLVDRKGSKMAYTLDEDISSRIGSFCNYNGREASMFRKGVAIGDSLTEGVFNTSDGYITDSRYSWPAVFAKLSGVEMTNKGNGGYTSVEWWTAHQNDDLSGYDFAVISLGVNDSSKIGPWDSTIETAFTNIINKLKSENSRIKIFVSTIFPATAYSSVTLSVTFSDAIRTFVEGLNDSNVILLDLQKYAHTRDYTEYNAGHLTALGYSTLAADIYSLISYIIAKNKSVFKDVQFIGTNHNPYNG